MEQQLDTIRLLILDDHQLFREGLVRLLESEPDVTISGQASTVTDALRLLQNGPIELVLLDWDLGSERGSRFLTEVSAQGWHGRVLVVTGGVTTREAAELIGYGVHGIFLKSGSPESLLEAIRLVGRGETFFLEEHRDLPPSAVPAAGPKPLSARETEVLRAVVEGLSNKEIGGQLEISESAVKATLQQLFYKTGVRTRGQLVRVALERYRDLVS
jgi:DNA-binding NarL/FixJ family response regulator